VNYNIYDNEIDLIKENIEEDAVIKFLINNNVIKDKNSIYYGSLKSGELTINDLKNNRLYIIVKSN
jgi:hypothetical protein